MSFPVGYDLDRIVEHLEGGGILAYPTETVYGLGGDPTPDVVSAIRRIKGREGEHPFLLLLPDGKHPAEAPLRWGLTLPDEGRRLAERFWPGPLTLVLADPHHRFPEGVRSAAGGVAVRVSPHPFVTELMATWCRPLISTSANRTGEPAALTAEQVRFGLGGGAGEALDRNRVRVIDGGPVDSPEPSTLVDCMGARPRLLRRGAISAEILRATVPELKDE